VWRLRSPSAWSRHWPNELKYQCPCRWNCCKRSLCSEGPERFLQDPSILYKRASGRRRKSLTKLPILHKALLAPSRQKHLPKPGQNVYLAKKDGTSDELARKVIPNASQRHTTMSPWRSTGAKLTSQRHASTEFVTNHCILSP